jgi:hypothetical protein
MNGARSSGVHDRVGYAAAPADLILVPARLGDYRR